MTLNINDLAALLARNNADEQKAIDGYFLALTYPGLPKELADDLREIISDEMNHSEKLSKWVIKLTGVKPATD
jgi:rubrerythrin